MPLDQVVSPHPVADLVARVSLELTDTSVRRKRAKEAATRKMCELRGLQSLCECTFSDATSLEALGPLYLRLKDQVRKHAVAHAEETKFRVRGENGWPWGFVMLSSVVSRIANTRGHGEVEEVLGGFEGTLVSDAWKPYDVLTSSKRQIALLHVNRWLEKAEMEKRIELRLLLKDTPAKLTSAGRPPVEFIQFADGVRKVLRPPCDPLAEVRARESAILPGSGEARA